MLSSSEEDKFMDGLNYRESKNRGSGDSEFRIKRTKSIEIKD